MFTIATISRKGGAGKTTLSVHLACYAQSLGYQSLLIDADPQQSATQWYKSREAETPVLATSEAANLAAMLNEANETGFNLAVIDTPPALTDDIHHACEYADFVLIPARPSVLDLRAIAGSVEIVADTKAQAGIVINSAPPKRGPFEQGITREALDVAESMGLPVGPVIHQRAAFAHALIDGRAVHEFEPKGQAAKEIKSLWEWVKECQQ